MPDSTFPQPPTPQACVSCGSQHTRIVGQSGTPPVIHRRCEECGHLWSRTLEERDGAG